MYQRVENHDIVIPFELLKSLNHHEVDIVIFPKKSKPPSEKDDLMSLLKRNKKTDPFQKVKNPVLWQRKIRSEW